MSANIQARHNRARDNRAYVRELLAGRQPAFAALLRAVEQQMDRERPHDPGDWGRTMNRTMNTAWLYHPDGSGCVDGWSCREQDHTSIPPRCSVRAGGQPAGCELPQGHPGPHLLFADGEYCGAGDGYPPALAS